MLFPFLPQYILMAGQLNLLIKAVGVCPVLGPLDGDDSFFPSRAWQRELRSILGAKYQRAVCELAEVRWSQVS